MLARSAVLSAVIDSEEKDFEQLVSILPEQDRALLRLHYRDGWSWAALEDRLHYSQRYMKRRTAAALRRVENLLFPA